MVRGFVESGDEGGDESGGKKEIADGSGAWALQRRGVHLGVLAFALLLDPLLHLGVLFTDLLRLLRLLPRLLLLDRLTRRERAAIEAVRSPRLRHVGLLGLRARAGGVIDRGVVETFELLKAVWNDTTDESHRRPRFEAGLQHTSARRLRWSRTSRTFR